MNELEDRAIAAIRISPDGLPVDGMEIIEDLARWLGHPDAGVRTYNGWLELLRRPS